MVIWLGRPKQWWLVHLRSLVFSPSFTLAGTERPLIYIASIEK